MQTQARREAFAAQQLENQGYATFFPRRLLTVRHARRLHRRQASYFPNYIFVALDLANDRWRPVNGTYGVRSLVMFGGTPAALPPGFVECLKASADAGGILEVATPFGPGDKVRMLSGPFTDLLGTIDRLEAGDRVRVLMDLVHGAVPVVTRSGDIALAS